MNWKQIIIGVVLGLIVVFGAIFAYTLLTTKSHSPVDTVTYQGENLQISVKYCRPYKKDRVIFGSEEEGALQPYGKYWRTGANEATEITFNQDVLFGGKPVEAGSYVLYSIPGPDSWTIGLNSELGRWGAWEVDHEKDIIQVDVVSQSEPETIEQFTIDFSQTSVGTALNLKWDQTKVAIPIQGQPER